MRRGILATRQELLALRQQVIRKPFDHIYDFLRQRCALTLETSPASEAQWRLMSAQGSEASALLAARAAQGRIIDLAIAHHIEPNAAYRDRAIEELRCLTQWSAWVDPSHAALGADLCTAEAAVAATVGLDWLWDDLSEIERLRVLQAIRHKAIEPYLKAVSAGAWWYNCYHAWNAVMNAGCGLAALAMEDESPAARDAHHLAAEGLKAFFAALGREGGWDEGIGYWGYALRYVLLLGEAMSRANHDLSIFHMRGMDATGLFPVYFTPNGQPASFGEMPSVPLVGAAYLLVRHFGLRELAWWLDTYSFHRDPGAAEWSAAGLALLMRPADIEPVHTVQLQPLKVFHEIGWVSMADQWPRPTLYVAAKSGDLAAHLSRQDMNAVQLQVGGELLLSEPGRTSRPLGSFDRGQPENRTGEHNTLRVGQRDHSPDAQGSILDAQTGRNYRWVACDAGTACGENVQFIRHVVMVVHPSSSAGRMVVVLDEVSNRVPEAVELFWHTAGRIELSEGRHAGRIAGASSDLSFAMAANLPLSVSSHEPAHAGNHRGTIRARIADAQTLRLASVFVPGNFAGAVELKAMTGGKVVVKAGGVELRFKTMRKHLQLESVTAKS